jgi:hypothetical protein
VRAALAAMVASTAVPPRARRSRPACMAFGSAAATRAPAVPGR